MATWPALLVDASGAMYAHDVWAAADQPPPFVRVVSKSLLLTPSDRPDDTSIDLPYRGQLSGLALYSQMHVMSWTVRVLPSATRAAAEAELDRAAELHTFGPLVKLSICGPTVNLDAIDAPHQYEGIYLGQMKGASPAP